uniref:Uncharacterized protein LOC112840745 n=1 Tax=Callorhinus ursinus TaxID=34884 RepID=A0A3Q7QTN0_CALUR|nr:uncharacterized protein LOC112840745 [Callorhinus ursinus]
MNQVKGLRRGGVHIGSRNMQRKTFRKVTLITRVGRQKWGVPPGSREKQKNKMKNPKEMESMREKGCCEDLMTRNGTLPTMPMNTAIFKADGNLLSSCLSTQSGGLLSNLPTERRTCMETPVRVGIITVVTVIITTVTTVILLSDCNVLYKTECVVSILVTTHRGHMERKNKETLHRKGWAYMRSHHHHVSSSPSPCTVGCLGVGGGEEKDPQIMAWEEEEFLEVDANSFPPDVEPLLETLLDVWAGTKGYYASWGRPQDRGGERRELELTACGSGRPVPVPVPTVAVTIPLPSPGLSHSLSHLQLMPQLLAAVPLAPAGQCHRDVQWPSHLPLTHPRS